HLGNLAVLKQEQLELFVSVSDRMKKESVPLIQKFADLGFEITATEGTAAFLAQKGIQTKEMLKNNEDLMSHWKEHTTHLVLNIPNQGREKEKIGFFIRELSVRYQTPYFTSLDTLDAITNLLRGGKIEEVPVSLTDYLKKKETV